MSDTGQQAASATANNEKALCEALRGHHDGALFLARTVGDDVEDQRRIRIRTALDKKLPKLMACRADGDVTVLILEYADIALTNQVLVGQALEAELVDRDCPDHIFLADTTGDETWSFFQPVADQLFSIDMEYIDVVPPTVEPLCAARNDRREGDS